MIDFNIEKYDFDEDVSFKNEVKEIRLDVTVRKILDKLLKKYLTILQTRLSITLPELNNDLDYLCQSVLNIPKERYRVILKNKKMMCLMDLLSNKPIFTYPVADAWLYKVAILVKYIIADYYYSNSKAGNIKLNKWYSGEFQAIKEL